MLKFLLFDLLSPFNSDTSATWKSPHLYWVCLFELLLSCTTRLRPDRILDQIFHGMKSNRYTYRIHQHPSVLKTCNICSTALWWLINLSPRANSPITIWEITTALVSTSPLPPEGRQVSDNSLCLHLVVPVIYTTGTWAAVVLHYKHHLYVVSLLLFHVSSIVNCIVLPGGNQSKSKREIQMISLKG